MRRIKTGRMRMQRGTFLSSSKLVNRCVFSVHDVGADLN